MITLLCYIQFYRNVNRFSKLFLISVRIFLTSFHEETGALLKRLVV